MKYFQQYRTWSKWNGKINLQTANDMIGTSNVRRNHKLHLHLMLYNFRFLSAGWYNDLFGWMRSDGFYDKFNFQDFVFYLSYLLVINWFLTQNITGKDMGKKCKIIHWTEICPPILSSWQQRQFINISRAMD